MLSKYFQEDHGQQLSENIHRSSGKAVATSVNYLLQEGWVGGDVYGILQTINKHDTKKNITSFPMWNQVSMCKNMTVFRTQLEPNWQCICV